MIGFRLNMMLYWMCLERGNSIGGLSIFRTPPLPPHPPPLLSGPIILPSSKSPPKWWVKGKQPHFPTLITPRNSQHNDPLLGCKLGLQLLLAQQAIHHLQSPASGNSFGPKRTHRVVTGLQNNRPKKNDSHQSLLQMSIYLCLMYMPDTSSYSGIWEVSPAMSLATMGTACIVKWMAIDGHTKSLLIGNLD